MWFTADAQPSGQRGGAGAPATVTSTSRGMDLTGQAAAAAAVGVSGTVGGDPVGRGPVASGHSPGAAAFGSAAGPGGAYAGVQDNAGQREASELRSVLEQKENRIAELEARLGSYEPPNWPPGYPIMYRNVQEHFPPGRTRTLVRMYHIYWHFFILGLLINVLFGFSLIGVDDERPGSVLLLNFFWVIICTPGSVILWYRPMYNCLRTSSARFLIAAGWFCAHIVFCALMLSGFKVGGAGLTQLIDFAGDGNFRSVMAILGTVIWGIEVGFGAQLLLRSYRLFRNRGGSMEQEQQAVVRDAARSII